MSEHPGPRLPESSQHAPTRLERGNRRQPSDSTIPTVPEHTDRAVAEHRPKPDAETLQLGRRHGTYAKYVVELCRCGACRQGARDYRRRSAAQIEPPYVNADPARAHVAWLATHGVGLKTVARRSGIATGTLSKLVYGTYDPPRPPSKRIRPATLAAILAVRPDSHQDGTRTPAEPVWAMVGELVAAGVTKTQIARRLGQTGPLQLGRRFVTRRNAAAIRIMRDELSRGTLTVERRTRWGATTRPARPAPAVNGAACDRPSISRYQKGRCKCDECRSIAAEHRRRRRATNPTDDNPILALAVILETRIDQAAWRRHAVCRGVAAWVFYPEPDDEPTLAAARRVCESCRVRQECLAAHIDEPDGVFGGLTASERRGLKRVLALRDRTA